MNIPNVILEVNLIPTSARNVAARRHYAAAVRRASAGWLDCNLPPCPPQTLL